jgi:hypothetical protein
LRLLLRLLRFLSSLSLFENENNDDDDDDDDDEEDDDDEPKI